MHCLITAFYLGLPQSVGSCIREPAWFGECMAASNCLVQCRFFGRASSTAPYVSIREGTAVSPNRSSLWHSGPQGPGSGSARIWCALLLLCQLTSSACCLCSAEIFDVVWVLATTCFSCSVHSLVHFLFMHLFTQHEQFNLLSGIAHYAQKIV